MRVNWDEVKVDFITHPELTGKDIARKWNIPVATVYDHIFKEGWARQRKEIIKGNTQLALQKFQADDLKDQTQRVQALQEVVQAWLNNPEKYATATDVVAAIKQLEVMMGGVSERTDKRIIIYEVPKGTFPEAKVFEGSDEEAIEGELIDEENNEEVSH